MQVNCILRSGLLFVTLSLAIARRKQSSFAESCYPRGTLSQAVDTLYVKAARLKATIPEDRIKNIQLLKKKTKKLFMKNCRFQEQLLSFFMEDVFVRLQLQACKETDFVEDFHSLRQKLSRCKKGVHRCTKCRLQFLTCKEKMDHKTQHRTFIKPKELEGLPPGTKVTIRASIGPLHSRPSATTSKCTPSTSSLQVLPPKSKSTTAKSPTKSHASKAKTGKPRATTSTASRPNASKQGRSACKYKAKTSYKQKKQRNRKNKISIALKNLRCHRGVHKCIECRSKIKDFASHFSIYIHCNFCKYNTNCNKAFINHMVSSHSNQPAKRFYIFKKHSGTLRGITLVCLKCDFLTDSSGLDRMAKHLSQRKTHTCQVIIENVPESTSASESTSDAC